jgi:hypothetical protein
MTQVGRDRHDKVDGSLPFPGGAYQPRHKLCLNDCATLVRLYLG